MRDALSFPRPLSMSGRGPYDRDGYRALIGDEADALKYGDIVTVLDTARGDLTKGKIVGVKDDAIRVLFVRSGCIMMFDTDNPNFWPDAEMRDRKPPIAVEDDVEYVIVTQAPAIQKDVEVFNAMKASLEIAQLRKRVEHLERSKDAVLVELTELRAMVAALGPRAVA